MARQLTEAAKAAKLIRAELKKQGVKAKVTSKNYSMGSNVTVTLTDPLPAVADQVASYCNQYQQGNFNGMEDIYEYDNTNSDLPQVKYVFVETVFSDEVRQAAWDYCKATYADFEDAADEPTWSNYLQGMLFNKVLSGDDQYREFWRSRKPVIKITAAA